MSSDVNERLLVQKSWDELFEAHSRPGEILARLAAEVGDGLPEDFRVRASPREPRDVLVVRGTSSTLTRRS